MTSGNCIRKGGLREFWKLCDSKDDEGDIWTDDTVLTCE